MDIQLRYLDLFVPNEQDIDFVLYLVRDNCTLYYWERTLYDMLLSGF